MLQINIKLKHESPPSWAWGFTQCRQAPSSPTGTILYLLLKLFLTRGIFNGKNVSLCLYWQQILILISKISFAFREIRTHFRIKISRWHSVGPESKTLAQHWTNRMSASRVFCDYFWLYCCSSQNAVHVLFTFKVSRYFWFCRAAYGLRHRQCTKPPTHVDWLLGFHIFHLHINRVSHQTDRLRFSNSKKNSIAQRVKGFNADSVANIQCNHRLCYHRTEMLQLERPRHNYIFVVQINHVILRYDSNNDKWHCLFLLAISGAFPSLEIFLLQTHNFKWVTITHICSILDQTFASHDVRITISFPRTVTEQE